MLDAYSFSDVTAVAIKKHIQKLREKSEKGDVDPAGAGATSADGTTPKSSPKKGVKTPTKAAGLKVPTSGKKSSVKKGTKRNADDDAKESGDPQEGAVGEEEDVKVETMAKGKRIKLKNGQFQVDEDDEE